MLKKTATIQAKGIAALFIMIGHFLPSETSGIIRLFFYGPVWVGLFFFFSGYGIQKKSLYSGKLNYKFLTNIARKIWVPFAIVELIHMLTLHITRGDKFTVFQFFGCTFGIPLSNEVLWYVLELIFLEVIFYFLEKNTIIKAEKNKYITWSLFYVLYMTLSITFDIGTWWYISTFSFLLGLFFSKNENLFVLLSQKTIKLFITFVSIILYLAERLADIYDIGPYRLIGFSKNYYLTGVTIIMVPIITLMLVVYLSELQREIPFFLRLGEASYYIYLLHITVKCWVVWIVGKSIPEIYTVIIQIAVTILLSIVISSKKRRAFMEHPIQ